MITTTDLNLNADDILKNQLINSLGLLKYIYLVNNIQSIDLTGDSEEAVKYRTTFNSFYRLRRNSIWRSVYYKFFQEIKDSKEIEFRDVIEGLQRSLKEEGFTSIEPSFASKMLATINPDKPIWDSRVLVSLGLDKEWEKNRSVKNAIDIYKRICDWYDEASGKCVNCVREFDSWFPEYVQISNTKKIDFLLWSYGTNNKK